MRTYELHLFTFQYKIIISKDGKIGIIKNIIVYNNSYYFAVYYFEILQPFYMISNDPSTKFGVYQCSFLNDNQAVFIAYNEVQSKCYRMPIWVKKTFFKLQC